MVRTVVRAAVASLAIAVGASAASAQEASTLRFAYPGSPTSANWAKFLDAWTKRIEADANGAIKIQPYFGPTLANMLNVYDRTVSRVADIGWGVSNAATGTLRRTTVVELPSDFTSRQASGAIWRLYENGLVSEDWSEVRPLALFVYPASTAHFVQPVKRLEDLKGMKVATVSRADSEIYRLLGAAPVTAAASELYEMLNRRLARGLAIGVAALQTFKLHEVTSHHLKVEMACGAAFLVMNKDAYAKLPEAARRAIDRNSGFEASLGIGAVIDGAYTAAEEFLKGLPGHTVYTMEPAEKTRWQRAIQPVIDGWVRETPNGAAILAAYRAEVAKIRDAK